MWTKSCLSKENRKITIFSNDNEDVMRKNEARHAVCLVS